MSKEERRNVPLKNYVILSIIFIITILLTLYINAWINAYKESNIEVSPLKDTVQEITIYDIKMSLSETNETILYIGDDTDYSLDKDILKVINKEELNDIFYYIDVNNIEDTVYINSLKDNFQELSNNINKGPMLIYIKNGVAIKVKDSSKSRLNINDLDTLIKTYINN